jgi:serine/threonine-protein kinase
MATPIIVGRYAIFDEIAAGGMASVHVGRLLGAAGFSRTVAIKRLHPQFAKDPEFVAMFLDEARMAARVRHPNVVPTLDVIAKNGELFLVMEHVLGESLSRLRRAAGAGIPVPVVVAILGEALHGLHAAHEATGEDGQKLGLVHRDVSPQNILVGLDGVSRVLDFGVAKALGRSHTTRDGQVKGKLAYMAPEQLRGVDVNVRSDVYAASVVLWETLTGQRLFQGDTEAMVVGKILEDVVPPPSRVAPSVPAALDALVLRGLAKNPDLRFGSAEAMALALQQCVAPALASEVRSWVQQWAGEGLQTRVRRVAEIETSPPPLHSSPNLGGPERAETRAEAETPATAASGETSLVAPAPELGSVTNVSVVTDRRARFGARSPSRRAVAVGAGGLACLALLLGVGIQRRTSSPQAQGVVLPSSPQAAGVPVPSAPADLPGDPSAVAPAFSREATTTPLPNDAPPAAASAPARPRKAPNSVSPRPPTQPPGATTDRGACYILDSRGIWHIKPECLQ